MALLIGKRLDKKGGGEKSAPSLPGLSDDEGTDMGGDAEKDDMELSAISDFMSAKDPAAARDALKDFLASCYPQLADSEPEEEAEPEPEV
jgi:hypothetical protein